ncbi:hypothetical protein [uncultured Rubinisphaera sp.]|uniref:hypothetical protein n=1 Tax=uncultured Rubinisphaera sp. TaxID=1678686 RepID=UPI000EE58522|nr:hypothetical protein [Planctomycetaceae bacterium]|tara:strand:- start:1574 stop:2314 length:741 start_codon:yes stop_codon:yes gene_type:complete
MAKKASSQLWLQGRVPSGYWDRVTNRKAYMRWLAKELGYKKTEDWYQVSKQDFHVRSGGGLLANYYHDSPQQAVLAHFPEYEWRPWLFRSTSQGFWQDKKNRLAYMDWLGDHLGLKSLEDWYKVSRSHFHTNHGGGMLANYYGDSVFRALREYAPKKKWVPWRFATVPQGFWKEQKNRQTYLRWLGKELGYDKPTDWYKLTRQHFSENHGEALFATYYNGSIMKALKDYRPSQKWSADRLREARKE